MRRAPLAFAGVCLLLGACVYVVAFASARARGLDAQTLGPGGSITVPDVQKTSALLVNTIDIASLLVLGPGIVAIGLLRRRRDLAIASLAILVGANATALALKTFLQRLDPLGDDRLRALHGSFPSGHATAAMSLAFALIVVFPPAWQLKVVLVGAAYATCIGVSLMAQGWHMGSDVAGGFLTAGAGAGVAAAFVSPNRTPPPYRENVARFGALLVGLAVLLVAVVAVAVHRHPGLLVHAQAHRVFAAASVALFGLAIAETVVFSQLSRFR
jgi:membrane-associated phospholipid phosphatase